MERTAGWCVAAEFADGDEEDGEDVGDVEGEGSEGEDGVEGGCGADVDKG